MSDMKCPFCNETELEKGIELQGGGFILGCPKCKKFAHDVFWQELIRTRKALDVAVDALKTVKRYLCEMPAPDGATVLRMTCESATTVKKALEQITALEQKDK